MIWTTALSNVYRMKAETAGYALASALLREGESTLASAYPGIFGRVVHVVVTTPGNNEKQAQIYRLTDWNQLIS